MKILISQQGFHFITKRKLSQVKGCHILYFLSFFPILYESHSDNQHSNNHATSIFNVCRQGRTFQHCFIDSVFSDSSAYRRKDGERGSEVSMGTKHFQAFICGTPRRDIRTNFFSDCLHSTFLILRLFIPSLYKYDFYSFTKLSSNQISEMLNYFQHGKKTGCKIFSRFK